MRTQSIGNCFLQSAIAQSGKDQIKKDTPAFKLTRAEENYAYLKDKSTNPYREEYLDGIRYIPLHKNGNYFLSLGGQIRTRFEHYTNRFWLASRDENFYSQRLAFHSNIVLGTHFRLFGEWYHGYTSHEKAFAEYDKFDFFQAFAEFKFPFKNKQQILALRLGRQEMGLGATRLVGIREGPNIRRSFDMGRAIFQQAKTKIQAFWGKEVRPRFEAFDNEFLSTRSPQLWGLYGQLDIKGMYGLIDVYYLGFHADNVFLNDVQADETRHTIGVRSYGKLWKVWHYNTEIIYQFGVHGDNSISAFDIESDWKYELIHTNWRIFLGLKLQYTSGDRAMGDGRINTFNPMFVNPAYYSLAATITPLNMVSLHPSLLLQPTEKLKLYVEWAYFRRASKNDALYRPTRFINRPSGEIDVQDIGHQFGTKVRYEMNRNISFNLDISYFIAGPFLEESGGGDDIFHIAPTASFRFWY